MRIIADTREQRPYSFGGKRYAEVRTEHGTLVTGDYSLVGLADRVAVERKSLPDLVACLGRERERFERELARSAALDSFAVVVEASWPDLASGRYQGKLNPHAACQSVLAFSLRYRTPFFFTGSRPAGEYATWGFLRQYLQTAEKRLKSVLQAQRESSQGIGRERTTQGECGPRPDRKITDFPPNCDRNTLPPKEEFGRPPLWHADGLTH